MNNELLIAICWSVGAFVLTAFVVYLDYRRDQRRIKREARKDVLVVSVGAAGGGGSGRRGSSATLDKDGKHQTPAATGVVPTLNPAGRIETAMLPGPLFANVQRLPFPTRPGLHAKSVKDFYKRKCGGFEVLQPIMKEPHWYRFDYEPTHTLPYRLRVFNRAHRTGKRKDPTARTMAFSTAGKRSKALDAFVAMHLAEAANRGQVNTTVWRRPK